MSAPAEENLTDRDDLNDALDALECMVEQYLGPRDGRFGEPGNEYSHDFMTAGEYATEVLSRLRPNQWEDVGWGLRRKAVDPAMLQRIFGQQGD